MAISIIFTAYTRNGFKKFGCEQALILCETSFEKTQVYDILVLKFDKAILKK